ncbi:putative SERF-like protein [Chenopodium quinoa]|uniref:putative SERF-like protein n=1 Tax=Chenopodium quinoa TaxID=63459 RepID=UPI000B77CE54|nr:putative SERF-like protein [Chenopodium quinoa]XP_021749103.1 putative SERF-like protein [Chenopodium quinoa]XP_021749104.1 putative SERF-like protein [Chenopodium quinoa]XP_021749105.1 putative SERF-like protein [Chenopodium quinoa]
MTRGNQREKDRERAQSRGGAGKKGGKNDGLTPEQRRERDAKALQEKTAKKASGGGQTIGGGTTTNK